MLRFAIKRTIKSGLIGGKKYEVATRLDTDKDLTTLFKGYADEHILAYKSEFTDKPVTVKRSDFLRGHKFAAASMNEIIEFEDNLKLAVQHLNRMVEIVETGDGEVFIEP